MPLPNTLLQPLAGNTKSSEALKSVLASVLGGLDGVTFSFEEEGSIEVIAMANTWSRAARRKKLHSSSSTISGTADTEILSTPASLPQMQCAIRILFRSSRPQSQSNSGFITSVSVNNNMESNDAGTSAQELECTWTIGRDRALFESFWSHVCRKVASLL